MAKKFQRRKRNYLINKDLQGKLSLQYLLLTIVGILLFGGFFILSTNDHLTISYENDAIKVGNTSSMLLAEFIKNEGLFLLIGGLFIIIITIVWTHRIAGPLYRFEQTLAAMCERDLNQRIFLRKGDEGKELGTLINSLNQTLGRDIEQLKAFSENLAESTEKKKIQDLLNRFELPEKPDQPE